MNHLLTLARGLDAEKSSLARPKTTAFTDALLKASSLGVDHVSFSTTTTPELAEREAIADAAFSMSNAREPNYKTLRGAVMRLVSGHIVANLPEATRTAFADGEHADHFGATRHVWGEQEKKTTEIMLAATRAKSAPLARAARNKGAPTMVLIDNSTNVTHVGDNVRVTESTRNVDNSVRVTESTRNVDNSVRVTESTRNVDNSVHTSAVVLP